MGRLRNRKLGARAAILLSATVLAGMLAVLVIVFVGPLKGTPEPVEAQIAFSSLDAITKQTVQKTSGVYNYEIQAPSHPEVSMLSEATGTSESGAHHRIIGRTAWQAPGKNALIVSESIYARPDDGNLDAVSSAASGAAEVSRSDPLPISGSPDADQDGSNGALGVAPWSVASPTQAEPGGNGIIESPTGSRTTQSVQADPGNNGAVDIPLGTVQESAGAAGPKPEGDLESNGAAATDGGG